MSKNIPHASILLGLGLWLVAALLAMPRFAHAAATCGDQATSCGAEEHCCEHEVAIFGEGGSFSPPFKEGKCVAKEEGCSDYWCGNRHCEGGLFGTPNVCCVSQISEGESYKCAYNELNCPGNDQQLRIRPQVASANLE